MTDKMAGGDETIMGTLAGQRQKRKAHPRAFTARRRQAFLDMLALTCNVQLAARHAGIHGTAPYKHRKDPVFRDQWRAALETGYDRLEALVLEHGGAGMPIEPADPGRAADAASPMPFDFERAMAILRMYRATRDGTGARGGGRPRRAATAEETNAALMKALDAAERRLKRKAKHG